MQADDSVSVFLVACFSLALKNVCIFKFPSDTINSLTIETGSCQCWVHIKYSTNVSLIEYYDSPVSPEHFQ